MVGLVGLKVFAGVLPAALPANEVPRVYWILPGGAPYGYPPGATAGYPGTLGAVVRYPGAPTG